MSEVADDQGVGMSFALPPARIVSLVPSLTEALALSAPGRLVGATDWCTHPRSLDVARVRGTKNPDIDAIVALRPDLVVANEEENRPVDLAHLRERGLNVWVTDIRGVDSALDSMRRLVEAISAEETGWLDEARRLWADPAHVDDERRLRAVIPIWRKPWMHLGRDTYAGDLLARLGIDNVLAGHADRYPRLDLDALPEVDLVVLPDEPYRFTADDGPAFFAPTPAALIDGRLLTWYGPAMLAAATDLTPQLRATVAT